MLQETVEERKQVGLLLKGNWYIKTSQAVWDRVQIVERCGRVIRIFYQLKRGCRYQRCIEDIPIHTIQEARVYSN